MKNPRRHSVNPKQNFSTRLKIAPSKDSSRQSGNKSSENSNDGNTGFTLPGIRKIKGVKSEKRRSIKLNMDAPQSIRAKRNYMSLQSSELEDRDIIGARKSLAQMLQSNSINVTIVVLIILYCFITFIFTSIPEDKAEEPGVKATYHTIESLFLTAFITEVIVYRYAFKEMYFNNKFNLVNFILILVSLLFLILDIIIGNFTVSILLRSRGVMRLFHVPVILENIKSHLKLQRNLSFYGANPQEDDEKPTAERIIEILMDLNQCLEEPKF